MRGLAITTAIVLSVILVHAGVAIQHDHRWCQPDAREVGRAGGGVE